MEPRGGGVPVCNRQQEKGRGTVMSHPFQEGGEGTVMSYPSLREGTPCRLMGRGYDVGPALTHHWLEDSFPRRVGGPRWVIQRGRVPRNERGAPPITTKGRGWGADYVNVYAKSSILPSVTVTVAS